MKVINAQAVLAVSGGDSEEYQKIVFSCAVTGALFGLLKGMELGYEPFVKVLGYGLIGTGLGGAIGGLAGMGIYTLKIDKLNI